MTRARNRLWALVILALAACGAQAVDGADQQLADIGFALDVQGVDADPLPDAGEAADLDGTPPEADAAPEAAPEIGPGDAAEAGPEAADLAEATDTSPEADLPPACGCGDLACETVRCGETAFTCPDDCCVCGDDVCRAQACGETPETCAADCALWVCGNGACEPGETLESCAADCGDGTCGNGACEEGETLASCAPDCALPCGSCDDADPCTLDGCDAASGLCTHAPAPSSGLADASCDGHDDDCDGATDEDFAPAPTTCGSGPCAATGQLTCVAGATADTCTPLPAQAEACNGVDDDCDGELDEACPCPVRVREGRPYQFCTEADRWTDARGACDDHAGYHLVVLGDEAENTWVAATAATFSGNGWWTGLNDREKEGTFAWADGGTPTFTAWADGEPNNSWGNEDCVQLLPGAATWNDESCGTFLAFVCEHD